MERNEGHCREYTYVATQEVHLFVVNCLKARGMNEKFAVDLADLLVAADYRGHFSHGLHRLGEYAS